MVYEDQGNQDKAIEYFEKSLAIKLETLGSEHPSVASSYNNLGAVYETQGNYDKAIEFFEKSLAIKLKTLGSEHPDTKNTQEWLKNARNRRTPRETFDETPVIT